MRRNPAINGNHLRTGERIWIPDLLPASAGEPAEGLAHRAANGGEVRISADRRFVGVLDSTRPNLTNTLTAYERKAGKKIPVPSTDGQSWKRIGWSPDGRLLAVEGTTKGAEGGTLIAFDPFNGEKEVLLSMKQANEDLRNEGHCAEIVEIVSFRPIKDRLTYRLSLRDDATDSPLYTDWSMARDGSERRRN